MSHEVDNDKISRSGSNCKKFLEGTFPQKNIVKTKFIMKKLIGCSHKIVSEE